MFNMNSKISDLKTTARGNLPGSYGVCISSMLIYFLIIALVTAPFAIRQTNDPSLANKIIYYIALIIISMIAVVFQAGISRIHLAIARGASPSLMDLFWGFRNQPDRFLITGLLLAILNNAFLLPGRIVLNITGDELSAPQPSTLSAIGYALLAAGIIVTIIVALMFSQVVFLLLDHPGWNAMAAFRESYHMMKGTKWKLFCTEISFIGWILLGMLSFGVGYLWIIPYMFQTVTVFYLDMLPKQTVSDND